jgi:Raf kinase inhibitor-like YbhB/YbcL family protein
MVFCLCMAVSSCGGPTPDINSTPNGTVSSTAVQTGAVTATVNVPGENALQGITQEQEVQVKTFMLASSAFEHKGKIPQKFSCKGDDVSPELTWSDVPEGTVSFALIVDDPDAPGGTWVHWVYYDIPGNLQKLPEGVKRDRQLADGSRNGSNSWGKIGYNGPCPPAGSQHRYFFKLYALSASIELNPGATKPDVLKAMQGHILGTAEIMGTYIKP